MRSKSNDLKPIVEVKGLSVKYPSREELSIKDVSFSIDKGDFIWVAGESASGKSTLLNCLSGFIPHIIPADVEGTINFDGRENLNARELARNVGMVHQDPESQFCTEDVEDEIAFGLENFKIPREEINKKITSVLKQLNCTDLRQRKLHTLSGGEKQKIAIASLLVLNPEVLILDEPTSNLDAVSMKEVLDAVKQIRKKNEDMTLILAEHRIKDLLDYIDSVIKLNDGKIISDVDDFSSIEKEKKEELIDYSYPDYNRDTSIDNKSVVKIEGLNYSIDDEIILKDIEVDIKKGEIIALMGRNGSGKTTLTKHISGMIKVEEGSIEVFGKVMNNNNMIPPYKLGRKIGYIFQNPNHQIFENSIKSEMMFGPKNFEKGKSKAEENLKKMKEKEDLDEITHPHTLSFGQKRRLNIFSSSNHDPELIIIDEPFSGQDHKNALHMASILNRLWRNGKTLIIVTHDLDFAKRFCTRVLVMEDGEIVYDGVPNKLKNIEGEVKDA
ncbi:MAG: ABC transporter ATP-binding protein [Candidatus Saliniplasma sp.]